MIDDRPDGESDGDPRRIESALDSDAAEGNDAAGTEGNAAAEGNATAGTEGNAADDRVLVTVRADGEETVLSVQRGANLRAALLAADRSPYVGIARRLNCGGRGLCATCGVRIRAGEPAPDHWHDRLADQFGYPRLSCQVVVDRPMTVEVPEEGPWGGRE